MEIRNSIVKLDTPTKEIHVYCRGYKVEIKRCKHDKLGRVHLTLELE